MFAVDHVLVSDEILDAPFACHLGSCLGACCVVGDRGAPLEPEERADLEAVLPVVERDLRPEARAAIARQGVWEEAEDGSYAVSTVGERECVFVVYERAGKAGRPIAKCAIQNAYWQRRTGFEKPISCHLFPIRVERHSGGEDAIEVLNYEQIALCRPAVRHGRHTGTALAAFLERPLTRKYGADWYARFRATLAARRDALDSPP